MQSANQTKRPVYHRFLRTEHSTSVCACVTTELHRTRLGILIARSQRYKVLDQHEVMKEDLAAIGQQPTVARITGQTFARPVHCESSRIGNKTPSTSVSWPSRRNGTEFREDAPKLPPLVWKIVTVFLFATGKPHQESAPRLTDESRGMVHLQEGDQRLAQRPVEYRKPRRHGERPSVG